MKIVAISDTHEQHTKINLPDGDILIHAGDATYRGELSAFENFINWMIKQTHTYKICIGGNHELGFEHGPNRKQALKMLSDNGIIYLQDSGVTINETIFWGSPVTPRFFDWEWNRNRGKDIQKHWDLIDTQVNVLITHGPPHGILDLVENNTFNKGRDLHQGCEDLTKKIKSLKQLKAHVFGHLHLNGGQSKTIDGVIFANASICTEQYNPINKPIVFEI